MDRRLQRGVLISVLVTLTISAALVSWLPRFRRLLLGLSQHEAEGVASQEFLAMHLARTVLCQAASGEDTTFTLRSLDRAADALPDHRRTINGFRERIEDFETYVAGHRYTLTPDEQNDLLAAVAAYEYTFYAARAKILQEWRSHPDADDHGCLGASTLACGRADLVLDFLGPVFLHHNWRPDHPNDLAAQFIVVMREYGSLLMVLSAEPEFHGRLGLPAPKSPN